MTSGNLVGLYIFGSAARGDVDGRSDLDILAVVKDGQGKIPEREVLAHTREFWPQLERSVSWYGRNRLMEMWENGELFAWHLAKEAILVTSGEDFISGLGRPSRYTSAKEDILSFERMLSDVPKQLQDNPENSIYEAGLIYVCLRNICMSASYEISGAPDFSRYSPFNLYDDETVPISRSEYELAMSCRMAGQRGVEPPRNLSTATVKDIYGRVAPWVRNLAEQLGA